MNPTHLLLSRDQKRQPWYNAFLKACREEKRTVKDIIQLGAKAMRKSKCHHHFFGDYSWEMQSKALVDYAYKNLIETSNFSIPLEQEKINENMALIIIRLFEERIEKRIPVEYITHEAYYLGNAFYVNEHVLVPRSLMNYRFDDFLKKISWNNYRVLDLCAGSGCIGISLALKNKSITVDLVDISSQALKVANINIDRYKLNDRVKCIESDLFNHIDKQYKYDLIITNPPYVSEAEYDRSPEEFKNEPKIALESGKKGLDIIHKILAQASEYLNPKGILIAEIGTTAAKLIKKQYPKVNFKWYKYMRPTGKESFFSDHGVFLCERNTLPYGEPL